MSSSKLQSCVDQHWENRKKLEYLDLATEPIHAKESIEGIEFFCYTKGAKHVYHSENKQLNLLCDLQLNTLHNVSIVYDRVLLLSKVNLKLLHSIEEKVEQLQKKELLFEEFEKKVKTLPSKKEISGLRDLIIDPPQKSENIQILQLEKKLEKLEVLIEQLHKQWT